MELGISLLLAAHLLCVNVASGGPLVGAWLDWRGRRGNKAAAEAAVYLARWSLGGLVAGAALGLVIGWLKWDSAYRALWLGPLSYKLHWAVVEAIFSLVLMASWWLWLPGRRGGTGWSTAMRCLIAVLAAMNLLYHFPPLFSVATHLADQGGRESIAETVLPNGSFSSAIDSRPLLSAKRIGGAEFRRLMISGHTPALAVHVVLASIAMAGVMLLGLALRLLRRGDTAGAERVGRSGGKWALAASLLQFPVGVWTLMRLPSDAQSRLMGESTLGTLLLIAALVASMWLLNELVHISLGQVTKLLLIRAMVAMLVTVVLMTVMQQQTRVKSPSQAESSAGVSK